MEGDDVMIKSVIVFFTLFVWHP